MTLDELKTKLTEMAPGNYAAIHYDLYADFFPPGEPDQRAREACHTTPSQRHLDAGSKISPNSKKYGSSKMPTGPKGERRPADVIGDFA
jgi:hypothetical protein